MKPDITITPVIRASDYMFDVRINGLWVATAKNYRAADLCAEAIWQDMSARIVDSVIARLNEKHPCPSCGDPTSADLCAACLEDTHFALPLDVEFAPFGF